MTPDRVTAPVDPVMPQEAAVASLIAEESLAIVARRRVVLGEAATAPAQAAAQAQPRIGLALSGGGVRSATFGLGLLRGLAQNGDRGDPASDTARAPAVAIADAPTPGASEAAPRTLGTDGLLGRFDYLSTVSGGGYVGAMLGRLISTYGIGHAQALMARSDSLVLDWLRRNGRYLMPGGSRDLGIAIVTYLRAWLAIHTEFMFACMLLGLVVMLPHVWQNTSGTLGVAGWSPWITPWWPLAAVLWIATAPGLIAGYWAARDPEDPQATRRRPALRDLLLLAVVTGVLFFWGRHLWTHSLVDVRQHGLNRAVLGAAALTSAVVGQALAQVWMLVACGSQALLVARLRNRLTRALRVVTLASLALAGLGALDALSWWLLSVGVVNNDGLWRGVGVGGMVVLVLRTLAQPLQAMAANAGVHARRLLPRLVNFASLVGLLILVTAWLVTLQWFVFVPDTFAALKAMPPWARASLVAAVWGIWVLLTAGNAQMANTSSLHSFYRARIVRAYLAVGNRLRGLGGEDSPQADVTVVVDGDDTLLRSHRPEERGGPIHLVTTCLNQTRDDASGLYNADRKGTAVTASWRGFEVGPTGFVPAQPGQDAGTLGRWVAVSGAAASPGAGAHTSRGLALLVYFLGVRLGHWVRSPGSSAPVHWAHRWAWRLLPKPLMLTSEASATFHGAHRPWWYLSDGGHFENTAVYALLKRELDFIILSDAGCDAAYGFADIENLVRKARIDFGAEIEFYTREEASRLFPTAGTDLTVLSPEEMADNHSCRGVLFARIRYRSRPGVDGRPHRPEGSLLVVKPNLHDALDLDLLAYAQAHTDFPHESTGDQSFDEAQWESYHRLGEDFGRALQAGWLARLPGWQAPAHHALRVAARLNGVVAPSPQKTEPLWRRSARSAAIGTTLGVGATGTLLLSLWQVQEQMARTGTEQQVEARQLLTEVSAGLTSLSGACPQVPVLLKLQTQTLLTLRDSPALRPLEGAAIDRLKDRLVAECTRRRKDRTVPTTGAPFALAASSSEPSVSATATCAGPRAAEDFDELCSVATRDDTPDVAMDYWLVARPPATEASPGLTEEMQLLAARVSGRAATTESTAASPGKGTMPSGQQGDAGAALSKQGASPTPPASQACASTSSAVTTLYIQVYDEASRARAQLLAQAMREAGAGALRVAPIENVARSAELKARRKPVPWAQPTFLVHASDTRQSRDCAVALKALVGAPWVDAEAGRGEAWVRDLPASVRAQTPGVIELWLPSPATASTSSGMP